MTPERLNQIEELYHSVRESEPDQRTPLLAAACKDDEDLRREVESLLAVDPCNMCFLDDPVMRQAASVLAWENNSEYRCAPGLELGPYLIEARLGAGGMGEVYRAKDKRLQRTVALKVLPERLAHTPGLRQRLEREAKAISSLNHPRICTLYDIGREGEVDYLVMEFLEGETLAQRLKRGALPLPEVLELAIQIAGALAAAHTAGIVHRDLKPGNIMLTKSGAKLLDFGLAKVGATKPLVETAMSSEAEPITTPGTVAGTINYMSPEQIQGQEADARSDLFAFGATLYEMLTGKRAFAGNSPIAVASAIIAEDPGPVKDLQARMPPALERVVRRCLEKNPDHRWQNTSDLESELRWIAEADGTPVTAARTQAAGKERRRELLYAASAVVFLVAAIFSGVLYWRLARTPPRAVTAEITPPARVQFDSSVNSGEPALSPDGRALAFSGTDESGNSRLWIRSLDSLAARVLPGTEAASDPFWSADSRKLGFFADGKLKSVEVSGGPAVVVAEHCLNEAGGSWNGNGTILFVPDVNTGLIYKVSAGGGKPIPVIAADADTIFGHPTFLPDGKHFLFMSFGGDPAAWGTYFASIDGREKHLVSGGGTLAMYASGFLLSVHEGALLGQAFDPGRGQLRGDQSHRIVDHVALAADPIRSRGFDVSQNGTLIYKTDSEANKKRLTWFDRTGRKLGFTGEEGEYWDLRLSPDGKKLVWNAGDPASEIWVDDAASAVRTRVTIEPDVDHGMPIWSPDGGRIAFAAVRGKVAKGIYEENYSGGRGEQLLLSDADRDIWPTSWSSDGRFILYAREAAQQNDTDIWVLSLAGDHTRRAVVKAHAPAYDGQFSPDDRWVAYTSEESGRAEVYITRFEPDRIPKGKPEPTSANGGGRWLISSSGGRSPRWRRDGKELFYLSQTNQMMAAQIEAKGQGIVVRRVQALFRCAPSSPIRSLSPYDVSPDGKRFVINSFGDDKAPFILLVNWTANLK